MPVLEDGRVVVALNPNRIVAAIPPARTPVAVIVPGPRGPAGGGGGAGIEHVQSAPSSSWVIEVPEEFGRRPNVAIYIDGTEVEADVTATSINVNIQFPAPVSGSAVLT